MTQPSALTGELISVGGTKPQFAAKAGAIWLAIVVAAAVLAPLSPYGVNTISVQSAFLPVSLHHLLGTDDVGRDTLTRVLYGGRLSLLVAVTSALVGAALAIAVAAVEGNKNKLMARSAQRLNESFNAFPAQFALIVAYGIFAFGYSAGAGVIGALIMGTLIGAFSWPFMTPIIALRIIDFYGSPRMNSLIAIGAPRRHIFFRHLLPMVIATIWPLLPYVAGDALVTEGTLSFLGFGFQPPIASWGTMMATGESYIYQSPLLIIAPGIALAATVASLLAIGEAARRANS
jgi:peptide/nickel transport system permease protein